MYSTTGACAAYTAGAGAMYSTTGACAAYTTGAGAMYFSTGAGAAYTAGAGAMYFSTGAGAAYTAGAGATYSSTGAGASYTARASAARRIDDRRWCNTRYHWSWRVVSTTGAGATQDTTGAGASYRRQALVQHKTPLVLARRTQRWELLQHNTQGILERVGAANVAVATGTAEVANGTAVSVGIANMSHHGANFHTETIRPGSPRQWRKH